MHSSALQKGTAALTNKPDFIKELAEQTEAEACH